MEENISETVANNQTNSQYSVAPVTAHTHDGVNSLKVDFKNLSGKTRYILYRILGSTTAVSVSTSVGGDLSMPIKGYITSLGATVDTAGTTGTMTIDVKKNGTSILLVRITLASGSKTSRTYTVATAPVLDLVKANFLVGDIFTFDISTVQTTPAQGLTIFMDVLER